MLNENLIAYLQSLGDLYQKDFERTEKIFYKNLADHYHNVAEKFKKDLSTEQKTI